MKHGRDWRRSIGAVAQNPFAAALFVFLVAFGVSLYLQLNNAFADPDSFYHARMAVLTRDNGPITTFSWLPFTVLAQSFVDQHFLYHVLLIPFVTISTPLVGIKAAAIILCAVMITVFYLILRSFRIRGAMLYSLLLLLINPFMFRMGLAKTPSLGVLLALVGLWLIISYRVKLLLGFAWFYVWVYGGFALLVAEAGAATAVNLIARGLGRRRPKRSLITAATDWVNDLRTRHRPLRLDIAVFGVVILGIVGGLIVNPTFPQNVRFYEYQLVKIGIINYQKTIGVGGEWYPYPIKELIPATVILTIVVILGLLSLVLQYRKQTRRSWTTFILFVFMLLMTLKSRRYVEYYVPFAMLFGASAISDALSGSTGRLLRSDLLQLAKRSTVSKVLAGLIIAYVAIGTLGVGLRDLKNVRRDLAGGQRYDTLALSATWLRQNVPPNEIIVHSDWDEFPLLFYHDTTHRYIAGLDATFLYDRDPGRYWAWVNLTTGVTPLSEVTTTVRDTLDSHFVFLTVDHTGMDRLIRESNDFSLVYEDSEAKIYQLTR